MVQTHLSPKASIIEGLAGLKKRTIATLKYKRRNGLAE